MIILAYLLAVPLALLITLPVPFIEAFVALKVWHTWVPILLYQSIDNWWVVGWANMAISIMLRHYNHWDASDPRAILRFLGWAYLSPICLWMASSLCHWVFV